MRTRDRNDRGDRGQMMVSLVIVLCMTILGLFVLALVPVGAATNEKTRSQTAADAAALAGAEQIRTEWVYSYTVPGLLAYDGPTSDPGDNITPGSGRANAQTFAARNDARLVRYDVDPGAAEVAAEVENTYTAYEESGRARSDATARMDIDFTACSWRPAQPPPRPPKGPPTFPATLSCGNWSASYLVDNTISPRLTISYLGSNPVSLFDDLQPWLVE